MRITVVPEDDALKAVQFSFNAKWQMKQVAAVAEAYRKGQGLALPVILARVTTRRPIDMRSTKVARTRCKVPSSSVCVWPLCTALNSSVTPLPQA